MGGEADPRARPRSSHDELDELSAASGLPLRRFRRDHVDARVARAGAGLDAAALAARLRTDGAARERFRRSVAVSHSGLFRDPAQFELLEQELLPGRLGDRPALRVWSAGCADGSELRSVAIVLQRVGRLADAELLGSDLLEENLVLARLASSEPGPQRSAASNIRWERRDLVGERPPAGRWDLVLCRNVAIYLAPEAKSALHATLARALAPGGVLMLGRSERLADPSRLGLESVAPHVYGPGPA